MNSWVRKITWRRDRLPTPVFIGFPSGSDGKEFACFAGDLSSVRGLGRSLGGGHGDPFQYSCLENPHGQRSLAGHKELGTTEQLGTARHMASQVVLVVKNLSAIAGETRDADLIPGWGRSPGGRAWQSTLVFLPREFHGQKSLVGYGP